MTEGHCNHKNAEYLVRVKAQVMTRDDSTGGWVPMGGGGVSIVGLRKRVHAANNTQDDIRHEYLIHGQRMSDNSVVLNCILKKDVQYTKANPTFHHWKTEEKRFGLTFQTHADARAFDKGVKRAVEDLLEGTTFQSGDDDVFMTLDLPLGRKDSSSQSASTASTTTSSPTAQSPSLSPTDAFTTMTPPFVGVVGSGGPPGSINHHNQHLHRVHYIPRVLPAGKQVPMPSTPPLLHETVTAKSNIMDSNGRSTTADDIWVKAESRLGCAQHFKGNMDPLSSGPDDAVDMGTDYSYVQFARSRPSVHEYSYPTLDSVSPKSQSQQQRRDSIGEIKKHNNWGSDVHTSQPPLPLKKKKKDRIKKGDKRQSGHLLGRQRARCVYCNETFLHEQNTRGSCEDAPDRAAQGIERIACICCARCLLYHCMADAEGDYGHPCVCDVTDSNNCKKWTALTLLACFVPCLWCYWPLTACHRCGTVCGCCGARHKAT